MKFTIAVAVICLAGLIAETAGAAEGVTEKPTQPPTQPPTQQPTQPPTKPPTQPPTQPPTTQPPTQPPTDPSTAEPSTAAPTEQPTSGPTEAPEPMLGPFEYELKDEKNKVCVKVKLSARIQKGTTITDLPENKNNSVTIGGTCDSNIALTFAGTILKISFDMKKNGAHQKWKLEDFFVTANGEETPFRDNATAKYQAAVDSSFSCQSLHEITNGDMKLVVQSLKFQPYMNGQNSFGRADNCDADKAANNIVPIAVGAALAVLVIIVLVLYLIGRRKHQKGYQTV